MLAENDLERVVLHEEGSDAVVLVPAEGKSVFFVSQSVLEALLANRPELRVGSLVVLHYGSNLLRLELSAVLHYDHYELWVSWVISMCFIVDAILHDYGFAKRIDGGSSQELLSLWK